MKYYLVNREGQLVLFKVANELISDFEREHKDQVIASGNRIMDALLEFEWVDDPRKEGEMEAKPVKHKSTT